MSTFFCIGLLAFFYQAVLLSASGSGHTSASDNGHPLIRLDNSQGNEFSGAEGVVQIWHDGVWNYINGSAWDYPDAAVACRELGYKGVAAFSGNDITVTISDEWIKRFEQIDSTDIASHFFRAIDCVGSERNVHDCFYELFGLFYNYKDATDEPPEPGSTITVNDVACVSCTGFHAARLTGGSGPREGRVEVFYDNSWGMVCDDNWGMEDADVLCKELGYPRALTAVGNAAFGEGTTQKIWMDDVECSGNETSLLLCQKKQVWGNHNCDHHEAAAVICDTNTSLPIQLVTLCNKIWAGKCTTLEALFNFTNNSVLETTNLLDHTGDLDTPSPTSNTRKLSILATTGIVLGAAAVLTITTTTVIGTLYWIFFRRQLHSKERLLSDPSAPYIGLEMATDGLPCTASNNVLSHDN